MAWSTVGCKFAGILGACASRVQPSLWLGRRAGSIHAQMLIAQTTETVERLIDPAGLPAVIWMVPDGDDPGMMSNTAVQSDEVSAIARQDDTIELRREGKLVRILNGLICTSSLKCCNDIVAKLAKQFHYR